MNNLRRFIREQVEKILSEEVDIKLQTSLDTSKTKLEDQLKIQQDILKNLKAKYDAENRKHSAMPTSAPNNETANVFKADKIASEKRVAEYKNDMDTTQATIDELQKMIDNFPQASTIETNISNESDLEAKLNDLTSKLGV